MTGEFPAQRASNAENVFIWWSHHDNLTHLTGPLPSCTGAILLCVGGRSPVSVGGASELRWVSAPWGARGVSWSGVLSWLDLPPLLILSLVAGLSTSSDLLPPPAWRMNYTIYIWKFLLGSIKVEQTQWSITTNINKKSYHLHINGLAHDCGNSSVLTMELPQSRRAQSNRYLVSKCNIDTDTEYSFYTGQVTNMDHLSGLIMIATQAVWISTCMKLTKLIPNRNIIWTI